MPDGQQGVLGVQPAGLAAGAQVVVGTNGALEADPDHAALAAVTGDIGVHGGERVRRRAVRRGRAVGRRGSPGGRGSGVGRPRRRSRRRGAEHERREGMEREIPAVLLLL